MHTESPRFDRHSWAAAFGRGFNRSLEGAPYRMLVGYHIPLGQDPVNKGKKRAAVCRPFLRHRSKFNEKISSGLGCFSLVPLVTCVSESRRWVSSGLAFDFCLPSTLPVAPRIRTACC